MTQQQQLLTYLQAAEARAEVRHQEMMEAHQERMEALSQLAPRSTFDQLYDLAEEAINRANEWRAYAEDLKQELAAARSQAPRPRQAALREHFKIVPFLESDKCEVFRQ